jgi:hypothetical protein
MNLKDMFVNKYNPIKKIQSESQFSKPFVKVIDPEPHFNRHFKTESIQ